jgi:hypothetical protein
MAVRLSLVFSFSSHMLTSLCFTANYEMGGYVSCSLFSSLPSVFQTILTLSTHRTWVTDKMGYLYREMQRYGFEKDLLLTRFEGHKNDYFTLTTPGSSSVLFCSFICTTATLFIARKSR